MSTTTTRSEKLSFWKKAAYGIGDMGNSVRPGTIVPFWYTFFLTDIARLDLRLVSLFWLVVTVWDACNDPLFGALPFGASFALLWLIPPTRSQALPFACYTLVPASALAALRLLVSILPALLLAASIVVAWFYPLTRQRYAEMRQELARRAERWA
jgi:GPH family glycoside/pentoside/hexuronide:cation symporter